MKTIDFKSCLIGVLATALVAVVLGAGQQQPAATGPHYQFSASGHTLFVFDNSTGMMNVVAIENRNGKYVWETDDKFSVADAITKPDGAPIQAGAGRLPDKK